MATLVEQARQIKFQEQLLHTVIKGPDFIAFFYGNEPADIAIQMTAIEEGGQWKTMPDGYSYRKDKSFNGVSLDHYHFHQHGKKLFAINVDGTGHDGNHGIRIPKSLAKLLPTYCPDLKMRADRIIECLYPMMEYRLFMAHTANELRVYLEESSRPVSVVYLELD